MKEYFFNIKTRLRSSKRLRIIFAYNLLLIKKTFKIGFGEAKKQLDAKIDILIPTISKDFDLLKEVIAAVKKNVGHTINKIFIVSRNEQLITDFCKEHGYVFIDELSVLGYGKNEITYKVGDLDRSGWMFQQLLKLSGEKFAEMENYLVVDSDTILINPHSFIEDGKFVFLQNEEWNDPYFTSFEALFGYKTKTLLSHTSHMMIFNTKKLALMKQELEKKHGMSWDKAYAGTANSTEASCISDYDTYANWMLCNFPAEVKDRIFYNKGLSRTFFGPLEELTRKYSSRYDSLSFHSYIKK